MEDLVVEPLNSHAARIGRLLVCLDMAEIRVRVVPTSADGELMDLGGGGFVERFVDRVGELGSAVREITELMRVQLDNIGDDRPGSGWQVDEIKLGFSLDLEAEAGVVLAKAKTSAGFELELTWNRAS